MSVEKPPFALQTVIIVAVGGWVIWGLFTLLMAFGFARTDAMVVAGQIGDLFGGINALFSALAFTMVWWSGDMQRRELSLQRKELSLQLEELKAQREELVETRGVFKRQNFEAAFFQRISILRDQIQYFEFYENRGSEAVAKIRSVCTRIVRGLSADQEKFKDDLYASQHISDEYVKIVYKSYESQIGPYFRTLYHSFKLLDVQGFDRDEAILYSNLLRAQISEDMLVILAVNLLSPMGEGFQDLIERYVVLKHCPSEGGLDRLRSLLPIKSFGGN
ncbi:hypothetical protein E1H18_3258 [Caulobacter sp. RHG1]|nr:hypothetical protein [Caulobacter sp. RHG1]